MEERLAAEYLCEVLGSKQLKPNTGADSAKRPWLTDEFGKAARAQLMWWRNNISKLGLDEGCFMELLINDPVQWWMDCGASTTPLQDVACRVLVLLASSAGVERVFSAIKWLWTDRRASMLLGRAAMLAFVYFNTRVLARKEEEPSADNFKELFEWLDSNEETAPSAVEAAEADQLATPATEELVNVENISKN